MVVRTDVSVDWALSPRIVTVAAPSVDLSIQDLYDTLRDLEDNVHNMDNPFIISAAGKEALGGGVFVGITATLQNAQIAFEARTTSLSDGTADGSTSTTILTDAGATFQTDGVVRGSIVHNCTDGSAASVVEVAQTQLITTPLSGGTTDTYQVGDIYDVFLVVQCNVAGGNLVAIDAVGADLDSIFSTSNTQVVRTSASSATLTEQASIEFASFNGGVTVDQTSSFTGTDFPVGTAQEPVNNFTDALAIAATRGFVDFFVIGNVTIDAGLDYSNKTFLGQGPNFTTFTVNPAAITTGTSWRNGRVTGLLDAGALLEDCHIETLTVEDTDLHRCELEATLTLSGSANCELVDCYSGMPGAATPIMDVGGAGGPNWFLRNYNGGIEVKNMVDSIATIDMNSGQVVLNANCTGGTLTLRGLGKLTDNSTGLTLDSAHYLIPSKLLTIAKFLGLK